MENNIKEKDFKYFIFEQQKKDYFRCFWPTYDCQRKAINAHSIQNKKTLDILSKNGHVVMLKKRINSETGPQIDFGLISKNKATTFTGLCDTHDNKLFFPIDNCVNINDKEHLFLIAYRSVFRGFYAKVRNAFDIQGVYSKGIESGKFDANIRDIPFELATTALTESYAFFLYKAEFDSAYLKRTFDRIEHQIIILKNHNPSIAVSSVYSAPEIIESPGTTFDPSLVALNIFPFNNDIVVIFSFPQVHKKYVINHVLNYVNNEGQYQLYQISKLVLRHCENFVIAPKYFNKLPKDQVGAIKNYFIETLFSKEEKQDHRLYLF